MKTKIELQQAINNRLRQGLDVSNLLTELQNYPKTKTTVIKVIHSELDKEAMRLFNSDKQFKITE